MVRVVDCHAGDLGSNPGDPKYFPLGINQHFLLDLYLTFMQQILKRVSQYNQIDLFIMGNYFNELR